MTEILTFVVQLGGRRFSPEVPVSGASANEARRTKKRGRGGSRNDRTGNRNSHVHPRLRRSIRNIAPYQQQRSHYVNGSV